VRWVARDAAAFIFRTVGDGHCVAFVREAAGAPHTSQWQRGPLVRDLAGAQKGLAIATFTPDGKYGNHTDGRSHAAILIAQQADGLLVWDQWVGHPVQQRVIRWRAGQGQPVNDGDAYHVIITADPAAAATA
jgi:hypothetical protein